MWQPFCGQGTTGSLGIHNTASKYTEKFEKLPVVSNNKDFIETLYTMVGSSDVKA